jgi:hypothetical protein
MNQGSRDRADAHQQAYQNRENIAAGYDRQYSNETANRQADQQRTDGWIQSGFAAGAELLDW